MQLKHRTVKWNSKWELKLEIISERTEIKIRNYLKTQIRIWTEIIIRERTDTRIFIRNSISLTEMEIKIELINFQNWNNTATVLFIRRSTYSWRDYAWLMQSIISSGFLQTKMQRKTSASCKQTLYAPESPRDFELHQVMRLNQLRLSHCSLPSWPYDPQHDLWPPYTQLNAKMSEWVSEWILKSAHQHN